jgi:hypothetical protein
MQGPQEKREEEREMKWFQVFDSITGDLVAVEIMRDRCSSDNFVPHHMVEEYGLKSWKIQEPKEFGTAGSPFKCLSQAEVPWQGKSDEMRSTIFNVLPEDSDINCPIVGKRFDNNFGGLLLESEPQSQRLIVYTAQKPKLVSWVSRLGQY